MPKRVLLVTPMLDPVGDEMLRREVEVIPGWDLDPQERAAALADVQGLGGGGSTEDIDNGPRLEVIVSYGSGCEHIDLDAATAAGILVVNAAGSQYSAVAEHGLGLMLAFAKRIAYADRVMHTERRFVGRDPFSRSGWPGWPTLLRGKTLGVVGFGFIGRDLAEKCRVAFDMEVLAYSPRADPEETARQRVTLVDDLDELLARSDYVSLSMPLTDETRGMIGAPPAGPNEARCGAGRILHAAQPWTPTRCSSRSGPATSAEPLSTFSTRSRFRMAILSMTSTTSS